MYLLCMTEELSIGLGDLLCMLCPLLFAVHILVVDHFAPKVDGVRMSCLQFFVCGVLCAIMMFIFAKPSFSQILKAWLPILYAGVLSCGVAYTLQIIAQKGLNPTLASLLMSLESVFAVLAGCLLLKETMTVWEILGCVLLFTAVILSQLPVKSQKQ